MTFTHTLTILPPMSPKIIITKGERQIAEIEVDDRAALLTARTLQAVVTNDLTDPKTRQPYPDEKKVADQLFELGKKLFEASK